LPTETNNVTHETIHSSVLDQRSLAEPLDTHLSEHPELVGPLSPLEDALRSHWPVLTSTVRDPSLPLSGTMDHVTKRDTGLASEAGTRVRERNWLGKLAHEIKASIQKMDI
jgi:hypothetical protein